ncbi:MAG: DUF5362 family protein [Rhodanobacteraceae bacterium]
MNENQSLVQQLGMPLYSGRSWIRAVGILAILGGVFNSLRALFHVVKGDNIAPEVVLLVLGCLFVWVGVVLLQCASAVSKAVAADDQAAFILAQNKLCLYFKIQIVVVIVGIVLGIVAGVLRAVVAIHNGSPAL